MHKRWWERVQIFTFVPKKKNPSEHYAQILDKFSSIKITRRGLLQGFAGLSAGLPFVSGVARAAARFSTTEDQDGLTISVSELPVWRIDTRWFDGQPRLLVRSSIDVLRVELRDALFPGTHFPADMVLDARRTGADWHARFQLEGANFDAETCFPLWLLGLEGATGNINIPHLAMQSTDGLHLADVKGIASFRADWTLASTQLASGYMMVNGQRAELDDFHLELDTSSQVEQSSRPVSRNWISLAAESDLFFDVQPTLLQIGPLPAKAYIEAQQDLASMRIQAQTASTAARSATVSWQGDTQVKLSAKDALASIDFHGTHSTVSGMWRLEPRWYMFDGIAVEFAADEVPEKILLASAAPVAVGMQTRPPSAKRFVVSLPGCDSAMFQYRSDSISNEQSADAINFAWKRIPLDGYDLILRRAGDGLFCTVRFRGLSLTRGLFSGWQLEKSGERALIEFDLGPQHLLEEAVYISNWCSGSEQSSTPSPKKFPFPDELVALEIRKRYRNQKPIPNWLDLGGKHPDEITLRALIEALNFNQVELRDYKKKLESEYPSDNPYEGRFEAAGSTHLLFELKSDSGKVKMPFSMESLLSWAEDGSHSSRRSFDFRLEPVLPKRASAPGEMKLADGSTDDLIITLPQSLANLAKEGLEYATGIEAPARLVISPIPVLQGNNKVLPIWQSSPIVPQLSSHAVSNPSEIWNVRLINAKIRAVFSQDVKGEDLTDAKLVRVGEPLKTRIRVNVFDPPDPYSPDAESEFRTSLDNRDRHELVALTALYEFKSLCGSKQVNGCKLTGSFEPEKKDDFEAGHYLPVPIDAKLLLLSSQGASFKYRGEWDPPSSPNGNGGLSVKRYDHNAQIARDVLARVEYKGFLFPIGLPATLIKVTERRFCMTNVDKRKKYGQSISKLVQRFYIQVPSFTRAFPAIGQPYEGRLWGHAAISMDNFTTPDLDDPAQNSFVLGFGSTAFCPRIDGIENKDGKNVLFQFYEPGTDARYSAPLVFIDNNVAHHTEKLAIVINQWRAKVAEMLKKRSCSEPWTDQLPPHGIADVLSARLPFVSGERSENTDIETKRVILGVNIPVKPPIKPPENIQMEEGCDIDIYNDSYGDCQLIIPTDPSKKLCRLKVTTRMEADNQPPFYPVRRRALIASTQIAVLTGQLSGPSCKLFLIDYDPIYRDFGFSSNQNAAQIFGVFAGTGPLMNFGDDTSRSGGCVSPSALIVWLSRQRGLIGGPEASIVPITTFQCESIVVPLNDGLIGKNLMGRTPPEETQPRDRGHPDEFNPKEYFAAVLGDAKLLGVVKLVDVLDAVLKTTGTEMPTIRRQNLFDLPLKILAELYPHIKEQLKSLDELMTEAGNDENTAAAVARLRPGFNRFMSSVTELEHLLNSSNPSAPAVLASGNKLAAAATALGAEVRALVNDPVLLLPSSAGALISAMKVVFLDLQKLLPPEPKLLFRVIEKFVKSTVEEQINAVLMELAQSPAYGQLSTALTMLRDSIAELRKVAQSGEAMLDRLRTGLLSRLKKSADDVLMQLQLVNQFTGNACANVSVIITALKNVLTKQIVHVTGSLTVAALKIKVEMINTALSDLCKEIDGLGNVSPGSPAEQALTRARQGVTALSNSLNSQLDCIDRLIEKKNDLENWLNGPSSSLCEPPTGSKEQVEKLYRLIADAVELTFGQPECALRMVMQLAESATALLKNIPPGVKAGGDGVEVSLPNVAQALGDFLKFNFEKSQELINSLKSELQESSSELVKQLVASLVKADSVLKKLREFLFGNSNGLLREGTSLFAAVWNKNDTDLVAFIQEEYQKICVGNVCTEISEIRELSKVATVFAQMVRALSPEALADEVRDEVRGRLSEIGKDVQSILADQVMDPALDELFRIFSIPSKELLKKITLTDSTNPNSAIIKSPYLSDEVKSEVLAIDKIINATPPPDQKTEDKITQIENIVAGLTSLSALLGRTVSTGNIGNLVNVERMLEDMVAKLGVPTSVRINYDWDTRIEAYPKGNDAIFEPRGDRRLTISAVIDASLRGGQPSAVMEARLSPFAIHLFGKGDTSNFLSIEFTELKMAARPGQALECHTDVTLVKPGKALGFVNKLSEVFGGRSGFYMLPSPRGIRVGYEYAKAFDTIGGLFIQNIAFSIYADLPFDNSKVRFSMQLADKLKPFLISAGIYGGGGFLSISTCADTLELLEASFEYGAMVAFAYGPATGAGRVTAGIYIRMGGRDPVIEGFFCAAGEVSIAGLITMSAMLRVTLSYSIESGKTSGYAVYTFKFSIGFVDFSYSAQVDYSRDGDKKGGENSAAMIDGAQPILLARANTGTQTDVSSGIWNGEISRNHVSPLNLGLLAPTVWKRYWAAFIPAAENPSNWLSVCDGQKGGEIEQCPLTPKSDSITSKLKQIQWYIVPWGLKNNSMRLSLRIFPALAGDLNHDKNAWSARHDWPKFLASIRCSTLHVQNSTNPDVHVNLGDIYEKQLARMGLTIKQASRIWDHIFPESLGTPTQEPKRRSINSIVEENLHCSASLADHSILRAGQLFTEALGGFDEKKLATLFADGYVAPLAASSNSTKILNNIAAIYTPVTSARRQWLDQPKPNLEMLTNIGSWIMRTVPSNSPYSDEALDYMKSIAMGKAPNLETGLKDPFSHLLIQRKIAYATEPIEPLDVDCKKLPSKETFHDRLAGLASHPWLLKTLGLAIDLELNDRGDYKAATAVHLASWQIDEMEVKPKDIYSTQMTQGLPKSSKGEKACKDEKKKGSDKKYKEKIYESGLVNLSTKLNNQHTRAFMLTQLDIDRTPERLLQLGLAYRSEIYSGRRPADVEVVLQPQETVGMSLIERRNEGMPVRMQLVGDENNNYRELYLENLIVGYRADVQELIPNQDALGGKTQKWTSLCARTIRKVSLNGNDVSKWFAKLGNDESILVERVRTPNTRWNGKGYSPGAEHLLEGEKFRWSTWVLGAPSPDVEGASPSNLKSCGTNSTNGCKIEYDAVAGATPQRYGHGYRVGMRFVMIDGNSISLDDAGYDGYRENSECTTYSLGDETTDDDFGFAPFLRYEPLLPPTVLLINRPEREKFPSENSRKVIVASGRGGAPSRKSTRRVLVPPRCASVDLAIRHGAFDRPEFQNEPPPSAFENVVLTENGDFPSWAYAYMGLPGDKTATEELYFNRLSKTLRAPTIPYYPDPWAQRLVLGFYRAGDNRLLWVDYFSYYDKEHVWPNCRELNLEFQAVDSVSDPVLGFELSWQENRLTVRLAQGVHVTLRTWHEMDIVKLNQSAIVDQIVSAVSDRKLGKTYQKNLNLDALEKLERSGKLSEAEVNSTIRKKIIERLSRWQELRNWDNQTARPSNRESKVLNLTSFWMINPFQEIEILHAVAQPLRSAELSESLNLPESLKDIGENPKIMQVPMRMSGIENPFKIARRPGEISATFKGHIRLDRASTRSVDAHATWTDNASKATLNRKSGLWEVKTESRTGLLFSLRELVEVAIDDSGAPTPTPLQPELDAKQRLQNLESLIPVSDGRPEATKPVTSPYDFGDTRARVIDIELLTHARHANEFASVDPSVHTIKSPQKRVVVPGTERPQPPKVEYIVPLYQWTISSTGGSRVRHTREAGWFRIWLGEEWYSSGNGELLALVCWPGDLLDPAERRFLLSRTRKMKYLFEEPNILSTVEPFITRWGLDPLLFETGEFGNMPASALKNRLRNLTQLSQSAFPADAAFKTDLHHLRDIPTFEPQFNLGWLPDQPGESEKKKVVLALYRPICDPSSGRWYADIQIDPLYAYQPFVRLALARYQPHALQVNTDTKEKPLNFSLRLSRIVSTEFIQLLPERSATIVPRWKSGEVMKTFDIVVAGTTLHKENTRGMSRSKFSVRVEQQAVGLVSKESEEQINGGWVPVKIHPDNDPKPYNQDLEYILRDGVWRATVTFKHQTSRIYSLAIEEYEVLENVKDGKVSKLVYFDRIPIRMDPS